MSVQRVQIAIQGRVQGVGFRPTVYRIAHELQLTGWVQNNANGVLLEIQGSLAALHAFVPKLRAQLPPMAKITQISEKQIPVEDHDVSFAIIASERGDAHTSISPDTGVCSDCLTELFDPQSRYFRYPFLNCTHCGPRYSITRSLPYDRAETSMAEFVLCPACRRDYSDPSNRRYHAQPTSCAACGPELSMPIDDVVNRIRNGEIIALKGLGGYQLICDARNETAVATLRQRKNRQEKPFALMVPNVKSAQCIAQLSIAEVDLIQSASRPIVLLRQKDSSLPDAIAPGLNHLGVMLPSTPLHYVLFHSFTGQVNGDDWLQEEQATILVVTSANTSGNPLIIDDKEARQSLASIADTIVSYNRQIITRQDDSVLRVIHDAPLFIRRARGYVPESIQLPHAIPATLGLGGHLKNTFCITRGDEAFVSQHIGSLNSRTTIEFFHESLSHLLKFLNVRPERIAHDLHPDFYTSLLAQEYGVPALGVQHHHAHLASVAAEHQITKPVLGLVLDGYGYGSDGGAWGGELMLLDKNSCLRLGSFASLLQPGGELAAREPWRMAAGVLYQLGRGDEIPHRFVAQPPAASLKQLLVNRLNTMGTSSCGRLFDAASALLGIVVKSAYEGQAAMQLESLVTEPQVLERGWQIDTGSFNMLPTLAYLADLGDPVIGANFFHGTLIEGLAQWLKAKCREQRIDMVLLAGGCFLNQILAEGLSRELIHSGIQPYLPRSLPPNDGGISLGQAWIAGQVEG